MKNETKTKQTIKQANKQNKKTKKKTHSKPFFHAFYSRHSGILLWACKGFTCKRTSMSFQRFWRRYGKSHIFSYRIIICSMVILQLLSAQYEIASVTAKAWLSSSHQSCLGRWYPASYALIMKVRDILYEKIHWGVLVKRTYTPSLFCQN